MRKWIEEWRFIGQEPGRGKNLLAPVRRVAADGAPA